MTRRSGMTLIEVLVAIFIMAIGLLALLALFPLGMLRMAQALRDGRSAQAAPNAQALPVRQAIRNDPAFISDGVLPDLFVNPGLILGVKVMPDADPYGESYPILVDPIGYYASPGGTAQDWIAGNPGYLRRRPVAFT